MHRPWVSSPPWQNNFKNIIINSGCAHQRIKLLDESLMEKFIIAQVLPGVKA
jgi:hypothetical protein